MGKALGTGSVASVARMEQHPAPDLRAFSLSDIEILTILRGGIEFFGEEVTIQMIRVLGAAAARVADASVTAFFVNIMPQAVEQDPSGLELARRNAESMVLLDGLTRGAGRLTSANRTGCES